MKRVNNADVRQYVQRREEFKNNTESMYGVEVVSGNTHRYIVFSYGDHYPLFIYEWMPDCPVEGVWYENIEPTSQTTNRHRTQAHPHTACTPMNSGQMKLIVIGGLVRMMQEYAKF
jgi:hypothetical protein